MIATKVAGIDLIVDGHSHTFLPEGMKVGETTIVSSGEHMGNVGIVEIDLETKAVSVSHLVANSEEALKLTDATVDAKIAEIIASQETILSEVVGKTEVKLEGERDNVRTKETNLGNLIADAMRAETKADVAFTNGGGIRASIEAGEVTKGDVITVLPFGNYVITKEITGEALLAALEHGVSVAPEANGGFLQVSGMTFAYDAKLEAGKRVSDAKIAGVAVDPAKKYLVATNDFMAVGGDGYEMLGAFPVVNEFAGLDEILSGYMAELNAAGGINYADSEGRITAK